VLVASQDAGFRDKIGVNPLVSDLLLLKGFGLDTHRMHHHSRQMTPHMQGSLMVSAWWASLMYLSQHKGRISSNSVRQPPLLVMSSLLPEIPDPALRQPATLAAVVPVFLSIYAQAVLAILPNTFILKLSLLPFILWQAWSCVVGLNFAMGLAKWLGFESDERIRSWNFQFAVGALERKKTVFAVGNSDLGL
jgi:hypothetical protein